MRIRVLLVTALLTTGLSAALPARAGDAGCYGLADKACAATVRAAPSSWVLTGTEKSTRATLDRVPDRMPAEEIEGAPVELRVRHVSDEDIWEVMDEGTLRQVDGEPDLYATPLTYTFPRVGHLVIQARTFIDGQWFEDQPRTYRVTRETAPHAPRALSRTVRRNGLTMDAHTTRAAWTTPSEPSRVFWTTHAFAAGRPRSFTGSQPDWADHTLRFVASRTVFSGDDPVGRRVVLVDALTGHREAVALDPDGDPVRLSSSPSIGDGARFVAYTSRSTEIVTPSPRGSKVFVANTTTGTSRLLGRGRMPAISGNARYVAYLTDAGLVLHDRAEHTTVPVTRSAPEQLRDLQVAEDGSVVWSQKDGYRQRAIFRWNGRRAVLVAGGTAAAVTDDGRSVFCTCLVRYRDGGYGGVVRHDTQDGSKEVVVFGPTGAPSKARVASINIDPRGRFVVVGPGGSPYPLMPNVESSRLVRFDLDAP